MNVYHKMATEAINGSLPGRVTAITTIVMWFAVGAFVSSTIGYYIDPLVAVDLSGSTPSVVGGTLTAIVAFIATKFV